MTDIEKTQEHNTIKW